MSAQINVLIADDHEVVRAGYQRLLESNADITVVAEASSGEEALQRYMEYHPDVTVMDLTMHGIGGLKASSRILAYDSEAKILIFSVHENEVLLNRVLDRGVLGYISKRSASRVMIDAVRKVAKGEMYIGQEMVPYLVKHKTTVETELISELTGREFEVFQLLVGSKSVNEIAELLHLSPKTVGHHFTRIKNKLDISDLAGLTRLAIRLGVIEP
jgi:two-component system, NarL family, invasion response regulator UvrY